MRPNAYSDRILGRQLTDVPDVPSRTSSMRSDDSQESLIMKLVLNIDPKHSSILFEDASFIQ